MRRPIGRVHVILLGSLRACMAACIASLTFALGQILINLSVNGLEIMDRDFVEFIGFVFVAGLVVAGPVAIAGGVGLALNLSKKILELPRSRSWATMRGARLGLVLGILLGLFIAEGYFRRGDVFVVAYSFFWGIASCTLAGALAGRWLWGDLTRSRGAVREA